MPRIRVSPAALEDLREIKEYIISHRLSPQGLFSLLPACIAVERRVDNKREWGYHGK